METRLAPDQTDLSPEHTAARLREAIASGDRDGAVLLAERVDDQDAEAIFEALDASETSALLELVGDQEFAELLVRLDDEHAADVLELIPAHDAADVLEELSPDDATDIFSELEPEHSDVIFVQMEPEEAQELRDLLAYPPESAGGLMTPAFVSMSPTLRADQAIAALRKVAESAETVNYVYVTDPRVARDLMRDSDWLNASNYGNAGKPLYRGEVGSLYGVRVVTQTNSFVSLGSATAADRAIYATSGGGGTGTGKDIIVSFALGSEAWGVPQLSGGNPFAPRVDILDQADKSDPHNQNVIVASTAYFAALRLNPNYYIVHRSKTSHTL